MLYVGTIYRKILNNDVIKKKALVLPLLPEKFFRIGEQQEERDAAIQYL